MTEITEVTRGHIGLTVDGREARILGEALLPAGGSPGGFWAWPHTLCWLDGAAMSDQDRLSILDGLCTAAKLRGLRIDLEPG